MLWTPTQQFHPWPFDKEAELEATIAEVKPALFGESYRQSLRSRVRYWPRRCDRARWLPRLRGRRWCGRL